MKKSDTIDFSVPQRQSYVAILLIILKTYRVVFRQILPFAIVGLIGGKASIGDNLVYILIAIALVSMVHSIISFFMFRFYVEKDELVIKKGILRKQKISIDIDRVQTINFEQNILHKLFKVARLKADTAGSVKEEFALDAVDKKTGQALKDMVLRYQALHSPKDDDIIESLVSARQVREKEEVVMSISHSELLAAGAVENHIRSSGLIFAFAFYVFSNLNDVGVDVTDYTGEVSADTFTSSAVLTIILITAVMIVSFIVSMVRMVLTNYNLTLLRTGKGFSYTAGLFVQKTIGALDIKIQKISWSDNLLKKIIGIFDVRFDQAGSQAANVKKSLVIPSCKKKHIDLILNSIYPDLNINELALHKISIYWRTRQLMYRTLFGLPVVVASFFLMPKLFPVIVILFALLIFDAFRKFKKAAFGFDENYFYIKGGVYGDKHSVFQIHKLQSIQTTQTPYMRRKNLASLTFYHASGKSSVPYIPAQQATEIMNFILYKIESSGKKWM